MRLICAFSRNIESETYIHTDEEIILDSLEDVVRTFLDSCQNAELELIEDVYMEDMGQQVPQPVVEAVVNCENNPEDDLLVDGVSIVGRPSYFDQDKFPVQLLGSRYWVSDELDASDHEEIVEETPESIPDRIAKYLHSLFP